jgi:plasmid stabilization system protein ParE
MIISKDSKVYANRFIEKLMLRVEQLASQPKSGKMVPEINQETVRELIEGNYRIIYTLTENTIAIVRVHHSARLLKPI